MRKILTVNGNKTEIDIDPRMSLLDVLRDNLDQTAAKKGCNHGQCGACTVLVDGKHIVSCLKLAATVDGDVTTIEGIGDGDALHPMQEAFLEHDAYQCGYCTSGQIMSAIGNINQGLATDDDDAIREAMSGNLCRCSAYPNIVKAVKSAAEKMKAA